MIYSMTAFARRELRNEFGVLVCELRSVNHRYLESAFRLSDVLRELEPALRERLRQQLSRGKIDVWLRYDADETQAAQVSINHALAASLVNAAAEIDRLARHAAPLNAADILRLPGVLCAQQPDQQALQQAALTLFEQTLSEFSAMRQREGSVLADLIRNRLDAIGVECARVAQRMPDILTHHRQRLLARLAELRGELDPGRLEQEMVFFAQRIDVAEELDRLQTHVAEVRRVLAAGGAVGRKLDFLMQELNREANTLGSKSVSADSSLSSVELKVLIEQMREQIQNME